MHCVAGEFQLVIDDENIRWPQLTLYQVFAMQEAEGFQRRSQQLSHFIRNEGPAGQDLGQILIRILHDHEQKIVASELALPAVEDADEVRMGQGGGHFPAPQRGRGQCRIGRNELDRGIDRLWSCIFGEENPAVVRATQVAAQWEFSVDDLAFPLLPDLCHSVSFCLAAASEKMSLGTIVAKIALTWSPLESGK
jgi:hypothetical protein